MKMTSILLVLFAVFFIGCASGPAVSEIEIITEDSVTEEVKNKPVKIVTTVYYPVKVESYFGDGVKDEYSIYSYDESGVLLFKEELFNAEDTLQQSIVSKYVGKESSVRSIYNAAGNLLTYEKSLFDMNGNVTKNEKFDNKDFLQTISEYKYEDNLKSIWKVFNESGSLLSTTLYVYSDSGLIRIDSMSPGGELEEYFELIYDSNGILLENNHYNSDGKIQDSRYFEYTNGFLSMELLNRQNGSVLRKIMYKNDQFGNPVETIFMDAGDNVQERLITVYDSREEISYEK